MNLFKYTIFAINSFKITIFKKSSFVLVFNLSGLDKKAKKDFFRNIFYW